MSVPFIYRHKVIAGSSLLLLIGAPYGFCLTAPLIREIIRHPSFGVIYFSVLIMAFAWLNIIGGTLALGSLFTRNPIGIHRAKMFALFLGFLSLAVLALLTLGWLGLFAANGWWAVLFALPLTTNFTITLLARSTRVKSSFEEDFDTMLSVLKPASEKALKTSSLTCTICLNDLMVNPLVTPCGHAFCRECIYSWLMSKKKTCPLCRKDLLECAKQQKLLPQEGVEMEEKDDLEKATVGDSSTPTNDLVLNIATALETSSVSPAPATENSSSITQTQENTITITNSTSAREEDKADEEKSIRPSSSLVQHLTSAFKDAMRSKEEDDDDDDDEPLQINRRRGEKEESNSSLSSHTHHDDDDKSPLISSSSQRGGVLNV